jgi:hypothetical protein
LYWRVNAHLGAGVGICVQEIVLVCSGV